MIFFVLKIKYLQGGDRNRGGYQDDYDDYNDYDDEDDFNQSNNFIVFMRGLPFRATDDEITDVRNIYNYIV